VPEADDLTFGCRSLAAISASTATTTPNAKYSAGSHGARAVAEHAPGDHRERIDQRRHRNGGCCVLEGGDDVDPDDGRDTGQTLTDGH
jgi:hypothetical protein